MSTNQSWKYSYDVCTLYRPKMEKTKPNNEIQSMYNAICVYALPCVFFFFFVSFFLHFVCGTFFFTVQFYWYAADRLREPRRGFASCLVNAIYARKDLATLQQVNATLVFSVSKKKKSCQIKKKKTINQILSTKKSRI